VGVKVQMLFQDVVFALEKVVDVKSGPGGTWTFWVGLRRRSKTPAAMRKGHSSPPRPTAYQVDETVARSSVPFLHFLPSCTFRRRLFLAILHWSSRFFFHSLRDPSFSRVGSLGIAGLSKPSILVPPWYSHTHGQVYACWRGA
jgi:hypothetical protein